MTTKDLSPEQRRTYFILLGIMIVTGALNTIFLRLQNETYEYILDAKFHHPWFQSIQMFIGEFYCAIFWYFWKEKIIKEEDDEMIAAGKEIDSRPDPPKYVFLFSCMCDVIGSTLLNFALIMMATSVFQMLRGGIIIITCLFTITFLRKSPKNYHWLGVILVFIGIFLVGLASQVDNSDSDAPTTPTKPLGIILLIISLVFSGFQFVYQEVILTKYRTASLQLVAWESIWGMGIFLVLLPILEFIPCSDSMSDLCSMNEDGELFAENSIFALKQMVEKPAILFFALGQTISIGSFNFFGLQIVKYSSSATRSVMDSTRTIIVWLFFLLVAINGSTEPFKALQLCGFLLLLVGQLIYNQLMTVNVGGMDYHYNNKLLGIEPEIEADKNQGESDISSDNNERLLKTKEHISITSNENSKV
jgi:drug/metabolite transporter (DMT)-like permease